ncbi:MAG TPA: hypothetical protein EYG73_06010, partial [Arcobacter sp.]|nr:hypothetical protein [Arcobacter sp.]
MYYFFRLLLFLTIFFNLSYANNNTTNELYKIKLELQSIKLNNQNTNNNQEKQIINIQNSIKKLENKINNQDINQIKISKDLEILNNEIISQNTRKNDISMYLTIFGSLITIIVIFFSFKNEGVARSVASEEIKDWLSTKANEELQPQIDEYLNKLIDEKNDILKKIKEEAKKLQV